MFKCENCGYHYRHEYERYSTCHFPESDLFPAPCEEEDWEPADIDDDCGYDPYEGCYTGDC